MSKSKLQSEIDMLRAQVAELTAAREAEKNNAEKKAAADENDEPVSDVEVEQANSAKVSTDKGSTGKASAEQTSTDDKPADEENSGNDLEHQFQELIDTIDTELKEASPATVLAVFAAGILLGRLLPR